ncbi:MAG: ATP-binding protein [Bryobacteraceae bacterium]
MLAASSSPLVEPSFRSLFKALPTPCLALLPDDPMYTILAVSDSYLEVTMAKREEIVGRGLFEVFPPNLQDSGAESAHQARASLRRALEQRAIDILPVLKYDIRPPSQGHHFEERYWSVKNSPVVNEQGEVRWILQSVEDITAQQRQQHRLAAATRLVKIHQHSNQRMQAERSYLQNVVDTVREPLLVLTREFRVQTANLSFYQDFQLTPEEVLHHVIYDLEAGIWDTPALRHCLEKVASDHTSCAPHVITCDFPRVGRKVVSFNARKLVHEKSEEEHFLLAIEDITARQAAEEALRQSEKELRRSNEDLDQFARVASHDLRAPLHRISRLTQLLERRCQAKLDSEEQQLIGMMKDATSRMITLINDLLNYAEPSRGPAVPVTAVSADVAFRLAIENLQARIEDMEAEASSGPLPDVRINQTHLVQLLQNLIGNALNYRREETPRIHVSAQSLDDYYCFSVEDNGCGIEERYWERIFEPFARLHGEEVRGSGIGLAVCKKVVERAGGKIWVESQPGRGSTFFFQLPKA